mmetsp:Transcript_2552/g.9614  ORF Transcript_2552/g.9614 Transcript_2552/m.9614 type:complete len:5361 (-) Transcript_2552:2473-18555(-)|eukprot:CAMPEP_0117435724 /NCGR_PEP_ID=MMETSP0759-20121206/630_1 /TAXON_ID=63605 /ORGANISM="Percolomonas cosmopolitus, Strain WS" /LENGTH=5360 /DNA_ID=CAMNT_0005227283 /DNA_START=123 /DNA_END=16205 /DNA_ORIENTATION=-
MNQSISDLIKDPLEASLHMKSNFMQIIDHASNQWVLENDALIEQRRLSLLKALSLLLDNYPSLQNFILKLIRMNRIVLLDKLLQDSSTKRYSQEEMNQLGEWIRTMKKLLESDLETYSKLWNWSIFFVIINDEHCRPNIRQDAFVCVGFLLNCQNIGDRIDQGDKSGGIIAQWKYEQEAHDNDRRFLAVNKFEAVEGDDNQSDSSLMQIHSDVPSSTSSSIINVFGIPLYKQRSTLISTLKANPLVLTKTTVNNLRMLALAVSIHKPALVEGVIGSGKTAMIEELARLTGNVDMIKVNLDESFDSKDLLGTYVCTDVPGEFKWQPGALTKAVTEGKWLLIEDLDLAPFDVISSLTSLVESNQLFIPSRNMHITPAVGFQLFATQCLTESAAGVFTKRKHLPMANLWNVVTVREMTTPEARVLIQNRFSSLVPLTNKIIDTYETLKGRKLIEDNNISSLAQLKHFGRLFSFRDLIKWCDRSHILYSSKINPNARFVISSVQEDIFLEAIDVFCGMLMKEKTYETAVSLIASVWEIPQNRAAYYMKEYKPSIREFNRNVSIGRVTLDRDEDLSKRLMVKGKNYATTKQALRLMEKIGVCTRMSEPVLLTGETGTGKTSIVQHLARLMGRKLVVHNLNQQTDSADFIGGFRPVDLRILAGDLKAKFEKLFKSTFSVKTNKSVLVKLSSHFQNAEWDKVVSLMYKIVKKAFAKLCPDNDVTSETNPGYSNGNGHSAADTNKPNKQRKTEPSNPKNEKLVDFWRKFNDMLENFKKQERMVKSSFAFTFVPGSLVKALRQGHWILLDEINLASAETLERLSGLLEGKYGTLYITEKGDVTPVYRHPNFRLFACMNPPTDVGKKNLPPSLRNRFTEFFMHELTDHADLVTVVSKYLNRIPNPPCDRIVDFYLKSREMAQNALNDGAGQKPHYSLRTLARALQYSTLILNTYGLARALYEGFCMSFLTQLDRDSAQVLETMIRETFIPTQLAHTLNEIPPQPSDQHVQFQHFWLPTGSFQQENPSHYILTESIEEHLKNLARIVSVGRYPILLQGPTSAGKTSMISYLAKRTGHRFVRINNHESTDIQEYFGTYITNSEGKLVFQEGILVEAVRKGYWIVLDELNLAPTDILEALNRLLDDNRELFIPETQETIKPHPEFQLFATQNPAGAYGGRKMLSRAFRNRFQELHVGDIPLSELSTILARRYSTASVFAQRMINIMKDLQRRRQGSKVFAGKSGFITPRDLFRWAERCRKFGEITSQQFAEQGYILLGERLRNDEEKLVVKATIEKYFNRVKIDPEVMYDCENLPEWKEAQKYLNSPQCTFPKIVWTHTMKRLFTILCSCLRYKEPILFVGETGCGKTTVCQLYSLIKQQKLHILNCHQHTEPSDFLGSLRPVRGRDSVLRKLLGKCQEFLNAHPIAECDALQNQSQEDLSMETIELCCNAILGSSFDGEAMEDENSGSNVSKVTLQATIAVLFKEWKSLFKWYDGPLVDAMKKGDMFLIDEISLAEDAVLERLNSVLEPDRTLSLPEKGNEVLEEIVAGEKFLVMATMNPGGDFGKKELSPALRNRFTEIYVPSLSLSKDLALIIENRLPASMKHLSERLVNFVRFFRGGESKRVLSIRDVIAWIDFIKMGTEKLNLDPDEAFLHGAEVVLLDGVGIGTDSSSGALHALRTKSIQLLLEDIADSKHELKQRFMSNKLLQPKGDFDHDTYFGCPPFLIPKGQSQSPKKISYALNAPTTSHNVMKVLRALQLRKPLLLEGSPGVGKTSLIQALSAVSGHEVVRINLSEQTDMMDLLGTDLPQEGSSGGDFAWSDGIFLRALKCGHWVLLDELNLASQSVLEGLNSVLDHRGEIYIPEINQTFDCPPSFRIFACQNPLQQGGGRKGLPKSFLNRFTKVYVNEFQPEDLHMISVAMHPELSAELLKKIIQFNTRMHESIMVEYKFGRKGSPWEFNLRDVFRVCEMMKYDQEFEHPDKYVEMLYCSRMRTVDDNACIRNLFLEVFGRPMNVLDNPTYQIHLDSIEIGSSLFPIASRHTSSDGVSLHVNSLRVLHSSLKVLETILQCIQMNFMCIVTGPSSAGKTATVRLAAELTGNTLKEFSMTSNIDTVELLGGFEQVDAVQKMHHMAAMVKSQYESALRFILKSQSQEYLARISKDISKIYNMWDLFEHQSKEKANLERADVLQSIVPLVCKFLAANNISEDIAYLPSDLTQRELSHIIDLIEKGSEGKFQWSDGMLIEAMEQGEWVVIDNVNFCSPSVLDRLNSLLEPQGVLVMNERGLVNGELKIVKPHPNFRLFLVMDPKYGEISRAMRNRGVEIFMPAIDIRCQDTLTVLCAQLPSVEICSLIQDFHSAFCSLNIHEADQPTIRDAVRCSILIWNEISHGMALEKAITQSVHSVYITRCKMDSLQTQATAVLREVLSSLTSRQNTFPSAILLQTSFKLNMPKLRLLMQVSCMLYYQVRSFSDKGVSLKQLHNMIVGDKCTKISSQATLSTLRHACTHYLEFSTPEDIEHRIHFLKELTALTPHPEVRSILDQTTQSLSQWRVHPLAVQVLQQYQGNVLNQIKRHPFDLRLSPAAHSTAVSHMADAEQASLHVIFQKIQYAIDWIAILNREDAGLSNSTGDFSKMPLFKQSYVCTVKKEMRTRLEHASVSYFYVLVSNMCTQYLHHSLNPSNNDITLEEHFEKLHEFLIARHSLREFLMESKTLEEKLLVHWNWFSKTLKSLPPCSNQELWTDFVTIHNEVDRLLSQRFRAVGKKNYLWKYGGKPRPDNSSHTTEQQATLAEIAESAREYRSEKVNRLLLKGMSTLHWSREESSPTEREEILESLSKIPQLVSEETARTKPRQTKEEQLQFVFRFYNKKSDVQFSKHTTNAIVPVLEHRSLQLELASIVEISRAIYRLLFSAGAENEKTTVDALVQSLEKLINFVLSQTSRTPIDMTPYQIMVWKLKASGSVKETNLQVILSLLHSCLLVWHTRVWDNDLSRSGESNQPTLEISSVTGPNSLFHDVKSVWIMSLLQNWATVPIRLRFTKIEQMKTVVEFLCSAQQGIDSTKKMDWSLLVHTFCNTLLAFENSFSATDAHELRQWTEAFVGGCTVIPDNTNISSLDTILRKSSDNRILECTVNGQSLFQQLATDIWDKCTSPVNSSVSATEDMLSRGQIWALLGFVRCMLIIPGQPIDPTLKYSVMLDSYANPQSREIEEKKVVYEQAQHFINGDNTNHRIEQMKHLLELLNQKVEALQKKVVQRPDNILFADLYRDMRQFLSLLSTNDNFFTMVNNMKPGNTTNPEEALAKEAAWQFNAMQIMKKLTSYKGFEDIWVPFVECVGELRYGMRMTAFATNAKMSHKEHVTQVVQFLLDFPFSSTVGSFRETLRVINNILNAPSHTVAKSFDTYDKYDMLMKTVKILLSRACLMISHDKQMNKDFVELVGSIFETYTHLHDRVSMDLKKQQEEEEASVKYKKRVTVIETDEERIEKEMNAMLPTYVELYSEFLAEEDSEDPNRKVIPDEFLADDSMTDAAQDMRPSSKLEKLYDSLNGAQEVEALIATHRALYDVKSPTGQIASDKIRNNLLDSSFKSAMFLLEKSKTMDFQYTDASQLSLLSYASHALESLQERIQDKPSMFDIYNDPNIAEVSIAFNLLHDFVKRIKELLKKYEENPSLIQLIHIAERVLDRPISTPVAGVLTGMEVLMKRAVDWEEYSTSPAATIKDHISKIVSLMSRWRRIELENWKSVLVTKRNKHEQRAAKWWFQFYKLFNLGSFSPKTEEDRVEILNNVFSVIDDFLRSSTHGDLKFRVELLNLFKNQIREEHKVEGFAPRHMDKKIREEILSIIENMQKFYGLFVPLVEEQIESKTKPVIEKLNEFIKIAKWEDSNYYAVHNAGNRARGQLAKLSHQYGEILNAPCTSSWQSFTFVSEDEAKVEKRKRYQRAQDMGLAAQMKKLQNTLSSNMAPPREIKLNPKSGTTPLPIDDKRVVNVYRKSESILNKNIVGSQLTNYLEESVNHCENLSTEVIVRAQKLAKSKEPQNVKKRALLLLLSELKEMGIKYRRKKIEQFLTTENIFQQTSTELFANVDLNNLGAGVFSLMVQNWKKSDDYYYKCIYLLQKMRINANTPSQDLNENEIGKVLGFSDNLFYLSMLYREELERFNSSEGQLDVLRELLNNVIAIPKEKLKVYPYAVLSPVATQLNEIVNNLLEFTSQVRLLCNSLSHSAADEHKQNAKFNLKVCHQVLNSLYRGHNQLNELVNVKIFTKHQHDALKTVSGDVRGCIDQLETLKTIGGAKWGKTGVIRANLQVVQQSLFSVTGTSNHPQESDVVAAHEDVITKIQLAVQNIVLACQSSEEKLKALLEEQLDDDEDDNQAGEESDTISYSSASSIKIIKSYSIKQMNVCANRMQHVCIALTHLMELIGQCDSLDKIQPHLKNLASLVHRFSAITQTVRFQVINVHKSLNKLMYVLLTTFNTLLVDGFCAPQEEEEGEWSGETEFQEGTGMDEGEGMNDVSDEIENEDQLLDQKDMQPMENEKDLDENENGIEMESDFHSKMYDQEPKDENDDSDQEDEEEDELDKEMGDIDEEDPNKETVDKNMWDEDDNEKDLEEDDKNEKPSDPAESEQKEELAAQEDDVEEVDHKQKKKQQEMPQPNGEEENQEEQVDQPEFQDAVEVGDDEQEGEDKGMDQVQDNQEPQIDNLDLNDDLSDSGDDDEGDDNMSTTSDQDENGDDETAPTNPPQTTQQQEEDDQVQTEDVEMEDAAEEEEDKDDQNAADAALENEAGEKMEDEQPEGEEDKDEEDPEKNPMAEDAANEQELEEVPFGVQTSAGQRSDVKQDEEDQEQTQDRDVNSGEEGGEDVNKADQGSSFEKSSKESNEEDRNEANTQFDPNPYRSLGDAMKEWKEQLNIVDKEEGEDKPQDDEPQEGGDDYEFMDDKDQPSENDLQMKAPATEEQSEVLPEIEQAEDEDQKDEDDADAKKEEFQGDEQESAELSKSQSSKPSSAEKEEEEAMKDISDDEDVMSDEEAEPEKKPSRMREVTDSTMHTELDLLDENMEATNQDELTMDQLKEMNNDQEKDMMDWRSNHENVQQSTESWQKLNAQTSHLSQELCEQLRLILEPSMATKLKGDYKTGKRINMKKVIPYIASQFRKDKIWLRRTKPNKREYQVLVAIDDSSSMKQSGAGEMALQAMTLICKAMSQLEVGQIAVSSFGESMRLLHRFDKPFTDSAGSDIIGQFKFDQQQTQMSAFLSQAIRVMDLYKSMRFSSSASSLLQQLQLGIIISDGRLLEKETIIALLREAQEKNQMFVFVLIDNSQSESVLDIQSVNYEAGKVQISNYMDEFPFPYYVILRDVNQLPEVLSTALRQWFEIMSMMLGEE